MKSDVASQTALNALRDTFLERMPDFDDFTSRTGTYWREERAYKLEFAAHCTELLTPDLFGSSVAESAEDVVSRIRRCLSVTLRWAGKRPQNLVPWRYTDVLRHLAPDEQATFALAFGELLHGAGDSWERLEAFTTATQPVIERIDRPNRVAISRTLPTTFLMAVAPKTDIAVRTDLFAKAAKIITGNAIFDNAPLDATGYRRILRFADQVRDALQSWTWLPHDMIDVHSFLWVATADDYASTTGRVATAPENEG